MNMEGKGHPGPFPDGLLSSPEEPDDVSVDHSLHASTIADEATTEEQREEHTAIARRETKAVWHLRFLVVTVLFLSTVLVACLTYFYTSDSEDDEFEQQFHENAQKVLASLGASLDKAIAGVDAFVVSMLSYARDTNQTWPYVTIPDFEARSAKFLALTKAVVFMQFILVTPETRAKWENYTAEHGPTWTDNSVAFLEQNDMFQDVYEARNITEPEYINFIHNYSAWGVEDPQGLPLSHPGPFLPMWQSAPLIPTTPVYNWDLATVVDNESVLKCIEMHKVSLSKAYHIAPPGDTSLDAENEAWADYFSSYITSGEDPMEPLSDFYYPIIEDSLDLLKVRDQPDYDPSQHKVAGIMSQSVYWRDMIKNILPQNSNGILAVFESPCNPTFTYEINGPTVKYLGVGDFHDPQYDHLEEASLLQDLDKYFVGGNTYSYVPLEQETCPWTVRVFPSESFEDDYTSNDPIIFAMAAVLIFGFTSGVFLLYDRWVERRQRIVLNSAVRSNAIVSSLFPSNVRDRMYAQEQKASNETRRQMAFLNKAEKDTDDTGDKDSSVPIADVFPEASVLFADIAGFTSWSSTREPVQVFILLETLYGAFDKIAKRRGVFKIETIGDCYVAVCGVPDPRPRHAVVMVRFAADCRDAMNSLTKELELTLGPGTDDLKLRMGLHSGAVTAGVLRGEKSRFQLFGDTVNTASRMESNGRPNRIHVSQKTADILSHAGKKEWLTVRSDLIEVKGKGKMQTYWVEPGSGMASTSLSGVSATHDEISPAERDDPMGLLSVRHIFDNEGDCVGSQKEVQRAAVASAKTERLIDWNVKMLEDLIKKLVAHRKEASEQMKGSEEEMEILHEQGSTNGGKGGGSGNGGVRDEVVHTISLPAFRKMTVRVDPASVELPPEVLQQLRGYVSVIAHSYHDNPFHNFNHASHVTMSAVKLLTRITSLSHTLSQQEVYIHSFGVAMDPLAQLAIAFSALIHDVDHRGLPNPVLAKEEPSMAMRYENKSIAEQNSVDIAWDVFMESTYGDLRACLFATRDDLRRFRQLVVNAVIATDIFDPELKKMRDERWQLAFSKSATNDDADALNRKATIVLEHVIQASDVCHTMQHWTIYQKWNRCLFAEMYGAYISGRSDKDPTQGWYNGELWFFDNYVIPLAKKLKECQVFGASSHEFLDCAYDNRLEWENKGRELVEELKENMDKKHKHIQ